MHMFKGKKKKLWIQIIRIDNSYLVFPSLLKNAWKIILKIFAIKNYGQQLHSFIYLLFGFIIFKLKIPLLTNVRLRLFRYPLNYLKSFMQVVFFPHYSEDAFICINEKSRNTLYRVISL